jgi:hypothetical protein
MFDRIYQSVGAMGRPETLRIKLLGGFSVSVGSRTIQQNAWRLRKAAALVMLLALALRHTSTASRLYSVCLRVGSRMVGGWVAKSRLPIRLHAHPLEKSAADFTGSSIHRLAS